MTIRVKRGDFADLPALQTGEPGFCSDTGDLYIGGASANIQIKTVPSGAQAVYVATTAYGGQTVATQGATGLELASGNATSTTANKLVDSGASFTADLANKTVYNATDDTWAKITAVDSATQLSLSVDIMASGEAYVVCSAIDNLPEALDRVKEGFTADSTIQVSNGTFSADFTVVGKNPAGNYSLTMQGSASGTTTISGKGYFKQPLTLAGLTFTGNLYAYFGADLTWSDCVQSGASKLYHYEGNTNDFTNCTIAFGNDPGVYTAVSSTITKGYSLYVATANLGGSDSTGDGLPIVSGSATSTSAGKLIDSAANFTSSLVGKPVYNTTDGTWAKVLSRDSATQLTITNDIFASGEGYDISSAFLTVQKAVDAIPGTVNCITTIRVSYDIAPGSPYAPGVVVYAENVVVQGKSFSGAYYIRLAGSLLDQLGIRNVTSATQTTVTPDGAAMTASAHIGQLVKIVAGTGVGQRAIVYSNTTTVLTIMRSWNGSTSGIAKGLYTGVNPDATSDLMVGLWGTHIDSVKVIGGQKSVLVEDVKLTSGDPGIAGSFVVDGLSAAELYGAHIGNGGTKRGVYCLNGSLADCVSTYIELCNLSQYATNCMGNMYNVWSKKRIAPSLNSMLVFRAGRIDMTGTANESGMDIADMSIWAAGFDAGTAVTLTGASGTGYDLNCRAKSLSRGSTDADNTITTKNIDASSTET